MSEPIYGTRTDLALYGLPSNVLAQIPTDVQDAMLSARSRWVDGYLADQFDMPIVAWQTDLTQVVCWAAAYDCMNYRGYNPDQQDSTIAKRMEDAQAWCDKVSEGKIVPRVTDSSAGAGIGETDEGPSVDSSSQRGWSVRGTGQARGAFQGD